MRIPKKFSITALSRQLPFRLILEPLTKQPIFNIWQLAGKKKAPYGVISSVLSSDDASVCICDPVEEIILSSWLAGALRMASLRICAAHSFVCPASVPFDLLCPCPALQSSQAFLLTAVQPLPVRSRLLPRLFQILRHSGRVRLLSLCDIISEFEIRK